MNPESIVKLIEVTIWPIFTISFLILFKKEAGIWIKVVVNRMTKLSFAGFEMELAAEKLKEQAISSDKNVMEKLKNINRAKPLAEKFEYWMKTYNHPKWRDDMHLLSWLVADRGADWIGNDYELFSTLAELLIESGYETLPVPSKEQFEAKIKEHEFRMKEYIKR